MSGGKTSRIFFALLLAASFYFFSDNKMDPDLWGHVRFGYEISKTGAVPVSDTFSYSFYGARWINHEWLSELIFYLIYRSWAGTGLLMLKLVIGLVMTWLLYMGLEKATKSFFMRVMFILLSLSVIRYGFATRPQIFTYLCFAVTLFLMNKFRDTGKKYWIYAIPAVFLFWVNAHGGVIAGLAVLWLYAVCSLIKGFSQAKHVLTATVLSSAVIFINPYGAELVDFLIYTLSRPRPHIYEWNAVTFSAVYSDYFAMVIITAVLLIRSKVKKDVFEVSALFAGFIFSVLQNRHVVLFAILFCAYVPGYASSIAKDALIKFEKRFPEKFFIGAMSAIACFFVFAGIFFNKTNPMRIEAPAKEYPVDAVKFMKDNEISGNIFCFFGWGEMCISELGDRSKVFLDPRYRTVYGEDFINEYFQVLYGQKEHKEYLLRYPETDIMFLSPYNPLAQLIEKDAEWVDVFSSPGARIFLKRNEKNKKAIKAHDENGLIYAPAEKLYLL